MKHQSFIQRGLAAIARSKAAGDWIPAEVVIAKLEAKLAAALRRREELQQRSPAKIETGSTNVYADLGYVDAAEMQRKSLLAAEISRAINARKLTEKAAEELLGIHQDEISKIIRGQFQCFSEAYLLELAARFGEGGSGVSK